MSNSHSSFAESCDVSQNHNRDTPVFLRWTDHLTGKSCTLRVDSDDGDAPLRWLVSKYLEAPDPRPLVAGRNLLTDDVGQYQAIQDLALILSEDGVPGPLVPGAVLREGPYELNLAEITPAAPAELEGSPVWLFDISIDRSESEYTRNWSGFNRRRWERGSDAFEGFVESAVSANAGVDVESGLSLCDREAKMTFLRCVARAIWDSPFENYSRFVGQKLPYKTGDETLLNIMDGHGGICSEKVQALRFIAGAYGLESGYVFAGPDAVGPLPEDRLRHILATFDFRGAQSAMRFWQHLALEFRVDGVPILVDATNGNIPFLFESGEDCLEILDERALNPVSVRMATYDEDFYYHRAPDDLAGELCYAMENFIPEIDLVQVFDNELGLVITPDFLVSPLPFRNERDLAEVTRLYEELARPQGLEFEVSADWGIDGSLGEDFRSLEPETAECILGCYEHLLSRYRWFEGPEYDLGLAVVRLKSRQ